MGNRTWKPDEDNFVKENYGQRTTKEISSILNRTTKAIQLRAHHLRITKSKSRIWTPADLALLGENYASLPIKRLEHLLKRSWYSIWQKASALGLRKLSYIGLKFQNLKECTLSEGQRGYIAGLLDGEGSISIRPGHASVTLDIGQKDRTFVEQIKELIGTGHISKNNVHGFSQTIMWHYRLYDVSYLYPLLIAIRPYTIFKRAKVDETIQYIERRANEPRHSYVPQPSTA